MTYGRGPEYRLIEREVDDPRRRARRRIDVKLERWIDPADFGFYSGDHHIHAAGCAHYTSPTEGVAPEDMFLQVKGEGLNVGCVLTWGPCFDFQRQFFAPTPHKLSEPLTVLKYDVEVSGFGSQALGHVCLLNLRDQTYPGSDGTKTKGWPTWTTPRAALGQGPGGGHRLRPLGQRPADRPEGRRRAPAGRPRRGRGRHAHGRRGRRGAPARATSRRSTPTGTACSPRAELEAGHERAAEPLPNLAIPEMNGVGAMEICVTVAEGLCDFISAMDTPRIAEWNCWYHIMNCGFPLKVSGETDFPCMSGTPGRPGPRLRPARQGRPHRLRRLVRGPAPRAGPTSPTATPTPWSSRSTASRRATGWSWSGPRRSPVQAKVAFAARTPLAVAHGGVVPAGGRRLVGDTVNLHGPRREGEFTPEGEARRVELVVNGRVGRDEGRARPTTRSTSWSSPSRSSGAAGSPCGTSRRCTPTR